MNKDVYNTVIGTLAVDMRAVTFGTARGTGRAVAPPSPLLAVPNVTAHPSTASVATSYYLVWHYNCLWTLKGYTAIARVVNNYNILTKPRFLNRTELIPNRVRVFYLSKNRTETEPK